MSYRRPTPRPATAAEQVLARAAAAVIFFGPCLAAAAGTADLTVLAPPPSPSVAQRQPIVEIPPDMAVFLGQRVVSAEVIVEESPFHAPTPRPITSLTRGTVLTAASARAALLEVLDWGLFGDAWVNLVPDAEGVRVQIHAKTRVLIEAIVIDTHGGAVSADDLLREGELVEGGELVGTDLDVHAARMQALLARRGFPEATVRVTARDTNNASRVVVLLDVANGPPRLAQRVVFYSFGASALTLSPFTKRYAVTTGDRLDEPSVDAEDDALARSLRAGGYHDAEVFHDVVRATGIVTLRVRVDAGPKYEVLFADNERYDHDALRAAALGDSEGADGDLAPLQLEARLLRFYQDRGYLDAAVTTEHRNDPGAHTRALVFHVREGRRVRVVSRSYPCLKPDEIGQLNLGGPSSVTAIGREIDSFLEEELPGAALLVPPSQSGVNAIFSGGEGRRVEPVDLDPDGVYAPDTYERALAHVQDLYRAEGYLAARVGPLTVTRATCDRRSPAGRCDHAKAPSTPAYACLYDPSGLPLGAAPSPPANTCAPALGVTCAPAVSLQIPIRLGPRSFVYDLAFRGAHAMGEPRLAAIAGLTLGDPVSSVAVDQARRRLQDAYKEDGFAYAEVSFSLEKSADQTRARVRFDIAEGPRVLVKDIIIRGNTLTSETVIRKRLALSVGAPYRTSDVRRSQERIATLNVFSSVNVALTNPLVPEERKSIVVTVAEVKPQYLELRPGFSSGEGARGAFEYGHKNLFGAAVGAAVRAQLSYLPDFLILDPTIAANFKTLSAAERLAARVTVTLTLPEVGLGPLVRASVDGVVLQDPERYFTILKQAAIPSLYYRPGRQLQMSIGLGLEHNNLFVFNDKSPAEAIAASGGNSDVAKLLRAPSGDSIVVSQRLTAAWDRRDSAYNAHSGTYVAGSIEHDDAFATQEGSSGHFLRLAQTFSAYLPVTPKIAFATTLRLGEIIQLASNSVTYPDRFFFMGGFDSMRGWAQDTLFPQDAVDAIAASQGTATPIDPATIAVRGGNLMINPRAELRLPLFGPIETVVFFDVGNLWQDARYPFEHGFSWRAATGSGLRVQTPVGPLALDYGVNLTRRRAYEDFGALNFSIGLF